MKKANEINIEKKKLYFNQKKLLDTFLNHKTITKAQYDKSYTCMSEKMEMDYYLNYQDKFETQMFEIIIPFEQDINDFIADFGIDGYPNEIKYIKENKYVVLKETRCVVCILDSNDKIIYCNQKHMEDINMQVVKN